MISSKQEMDRLARFTVNIAADAVYWINPDGHILYVNEAACRALDYTRDELTALSVWDIDPDYPEALMVEQWEKVKRHQSLFFETCHIDKSGRKFPVEITTNYINFDGKEYNCSFVRDISDRKKSEREFRLIQEAVDRSTSWFYRISISGKILYANNHACQALGFTPAEMANMNFWDIDPGLTPEAWVAAWLNTPKNSAIYIESHHRRKDGAVFPVSIVANYINNGEEEYSFCYVQDITEKKQAETHIQQLAYYDPLTGLPNRALLLDRLTVLLATSQREKREFAVLFMDLDRFKYINDSLGHFAGDALLQEVAVRLKACVRQTDSVSRLGGDEFIILLPETGRDGAARVAAKILVAINQVIQIGHKAVYTQASIGISCFPDDSHEIQTLLKYADIAMYKAKEEGRDNYQFFTPELVQKSDEVFSINADLRNALENEQFMLHYQPQIDLQTDRLCGVEALLRWQHPKKGLVWPAEFISIAEENGQIIPVGKWVIKTACRQLAQWRKESNLVFPIAINISARQMRDESLVEFIQQVLQEYGLVPADLELEITEGLMLSDSAYAKTFLNQVHALGIQLAIDDFGTGYSSLSYLKKLPVAKLKIDQSFVREIGLDENDDAIVRSIIGLGHQFKLKVIAEGLETAAQLNFLKDNGCDEIQGYYISMPVPSHEFLSFASKSQYMDFLEFEEV